jgi:lipopolysaccharide export system protein LptA
MKKMLLIILCIPAFALLLNGQMSTAQGQGRSITSPWQQMSANNIERTSSTTWRLRGSVRIVQESAIITADEVDARTASNGSLEYDLRGNVHLTMNPRK